MEAKDFMQYCRFYRGEEECPKDILLHPCGSSLWYYEKRWVERNLDEERQKDIKWDIDEYNAYGMSDFSVGDGVPVSLKALLFNRFYHGCPMEVGGTSFRQWYLKNYLCR